MVLGPGFAGPLEDGLVLIGSELVCTAPTPFSLVAIQLSRILLLISFSLHLVVFAFAADQKPRN